MATIVPRQYFLGDTAGFGDAVAQAIQVFGRRAQERRAEELLQPFTLDIPTGRSQTGQEFGESRAGQAVLGAPDINARAEELERLAMELFATQPAFSELPPSSEVVSNPVLRLGSDESGQIRRFAKEEARVGLLPPTVTTPARREPIQRVPVLGAETERVTRVPTLADRLFDPELSAADRRALLAYGPAIEKVRTGATEGAETVRSQAEDRQRQLRLREGLTRYKAEPSLENFRRHVFPNMREQDLQATYGAIVRGETEQRSAEKAGAEQAERQEARRVLDEQADLLEQNGQADLAAQLRIIDRVDPKRAAAIVKSFKQVGDQRQLEELKTQAEAIAKDLEANGKPDQARFVRLAALQGKTVEAIRGIVGQAAEQGRMDRLQQRITATRELQTERLAMDRQLAEYRAQQAQGTASQRQATTLANAALKLRGQIVDQLDTEQRNYSLANIMQNKAEVEASTARIAELQAELQKAEDDYRQLSKEAGATPAGEGAGAAPAAAPGPAARTGPIDVEGRRPAPETGPTFTVPPGIPTPSQAPAPAAGAARKTDRVAHVRGELQKAPDRAEKVRGVLAFQTMGYLTKAQADQLLRELGF